MWRGAFSFHSAQTEEDNARFLAPKQIQWKQELPVHNFFKSLKKNLYCPPMASLKFSTFLAPSKPSSSGSGPLPFTIPNRRNFPKLQHHPLPSSTCKSFAATEGAERGVTEDDPSASVSGSFPRFNFDISAPSVCSKFCCCDCHGGCDDDIDLIVCVDCWKDRCLRLGPSWGFWSSSLLLAHLFKVVPFPSEILLKVFKNKNCPQEKSGNQDLCIIGQKKMYVW